jgi:hypothetical protein
MKENRIPKRVFCMNLEACTGRLIPGNENKFPKRCDFKETWTMGNVQNSSQIGF